MQAIEEYTRIWNSSNLNTSLGIRRNSEAIKERNDSSDYTHTKILYEKIQLQV